MFQTIFQRFRVSSLLSHLKAHRNSITPSPHVVSKPRFHSSSSSNHLPVFSSAVDYSPLSDSFSSRPLSIQTFSFLNALGDQFRRFADASKPSDLPKEENQQHQSPADSSESQPNTSNPTSSQNTTDTSDADNNNNNTNTSEQKNSEKKTSDDNNNNNADHDDSDPSSLWKAAPPGVWFLFGASFVLTILGHWPSSKFGKTEISWQDFNADFLESGHVASLVVHGDHHVAVFLKDPTHGPRSGQEHVPKAGFADYYFSIGSLASFEKKLFAAQSDLGVPAAHRIPVSYVPDSSKNFLLSLAHGMLAVALIWSLARSVSSMASGSGAGPGFLRQLSDSKFKEVQAQHVKTRFADVAGCDEAKLEIMEFVEFLKSPEKFKELGARIPKGALLVGPPGTGKTLLAKATAGEADVPFFSCSGSDFVEMFAGLGARRVRALFQKARSKAPVIVFIDEIDAIGRKRDHKGHRPGGHDERENTLNQLLVEMDGFAAGENVIVLAATNREDILDRALLRPGRFDRKVHVGLPEIIGRRDILLVHMKGLKIDGDLEEWAKKLATLTPGMSGAELANVCNEAALIAAREHEETIALRHFESAIERVIAGLEKKTRLMSATEKRTVAYHEAGHAIVGWYLQYADPLLKVSIVPRGDALGYAQLQGKDKNLLLEQEILDKVCMALGGRAAEQLTFNEITNGASDDLSRVTHMAYRCITHWGFNPKIGHLSFPEMDNYQVEKPYSEHTSRMIDLQVREYIDTAYQRTLNLLKERSKELELVANLLLEREVISRHDMELALGKRPWNQKTSWEELTDIN